LLVEADPAGLDPYLACVDALVAADGLDPRHLAAVAARLLCGDRPLEVPADEVVDLPPVPFWMPAGRRNNVSPRDVVGVLCKEVGIPRQSIGAIDITERSLHVWIAGSDAEMLASAQRVHLRGRPTIVKRADIEEPRHVKPRHGRGRYKGTRKRKPPRK